MNPRLRRVPIVLLLLLCLIVPNSFASAYNGHPKLVVVIVVDQLRGDLLERYHDEFVDGGFRLLLDRGAWFSECRYNYVNTRTGPGHATIGTGAYTVGHGMMQNEWWEPSKNKIVSTVDDDNTTLLGANVSGAGASPWRMLAGTFGDQLKLATNGKARVFGVALKDRSAILPVGYSADGAFWIDHPTGQFVTSTYYMKQAPQWVVDFNKSGAAAKYLNKQWTDSKGDVMGSTAPRTKKDGTPVAYYDLVGSTPMANDYTLDFVKALMTNEKLGQGSTTDLLVVSFSSHDILAHQKGLESDIDHAYLLALDKQLAGFFNYLGQTIGLAEVTIALTSDHGGAPAPAFAKPLRIPAGNVNGGDLTKQVNATLSAKYGKRDYVKQLTYPNILLNEQAFVAAGLTNEAEAEHAMGEAMKQAGMRGYVTKSQLASGDLPNIPFRQQYLNSYSPFGPWYVMGMQPPFYVSAWDATDHGSAFSYDAHVPLAFYGIAFKPGKYLGHAEPVDLAVTLSALLGTNPPSHAVGRVLTEALKTSDAAAAR